jgi:hypothetical protein
MVILYNAHLFAASEVERLQTNHAAQVRGSTNPPH